MAAANGPSTKNEHCSPAASMHIFRSKSKIGRRAGFFFAKRGVYLVSQVVFRQGEGLFLHKGGNIAIKGPFFFACVRTLKGE